MYIQQCYVDNQVGSRPLRQLQSSQAETTRGTTARPVGT
jgi:hypothetical protein